MSRALPPHPHREHLARQAKRLRRALADGDRSAAARIRDHHPRAEALSLDAVLSVSWKLADTQLVLAREYGFPSWPGLVAHVDTMRADTPRVDVHTHVRLLEAFQSHVGPVNVPTRVDTWIDHEVDVLLGLLAGRHPDAVTPLRLHGSRTRETSDADLLERPLSRDDTRELMARAYWFDSWEACAASGRKLEPSFEAAVDAVVRGDLDGLDARLRDDPALTAGRSGFGHGATLLHHVAANGVESRRQRVPRNAVAIARRLIDAGAEVDATCDAYGGGPSQTTLALLLSSGHPHDAGLQIPLTDVLLDAGARIEGIADDGMPVTTALAFGYRDAARHLVARGARVRTVVDAAGLGDLAAVRSLVDAPEQVHVDPFGRRVSDRGELLDRALLIAARHGEAAIARVLLVAGADARTTEPHRRTPLHWAAYGGPRELVEALLEHGADPSAVETYHGATPTDWAREGGQVEIEALLRSRTSTG